MIISAFPYPGGKNRYADEIISLFPEHEIYVEVFGGSAAVLLNKNRSRKEIYNDLDSDIVNFFDVVRERRGELEDFLSNVCYSREKYEEWVDGYFSGYRPDDEVKRAGIWFFLRYTQVNAAVDHRNGFSSQRETTFENAKEDLDVVSERMKGVVIENLPYQRVIEKYDGESTLFYLDPPYLDRSRDIYKEGGDFDHEVFFDIIAEATGDCLVSLNKVPEDYHGIFSQIIPLDDRAEINPRGDSDKRNSEVIALDYEDVGSFAGIDHESASEASW